MIQLHRNSIHEFIENKGIAVEVGVQEAIYTKYLSQHFDQVIGIDPFLHYPNEFYHDGSNLDQGSLDWNYNRVNLDLQENYKNITLIRDESLNVVNQFTDDSIDFVYLDGNHMYHYVIQELKAWWPKIKKGGVFGGHDHGVNYSEFTTIEVEKAVTEWATEINRIEDIITCHWYGGCGSWFIKK